MEDKAIKIVEQVILAFTIIMAVGIFFTFTSYGLLYQTALMNMYHNEMMAGMVSMLLVLVINPFTHGLLGSTFIVHKINRRLEQ